MMMHSLISTRTVIFIALLFVYLLHIHFNSVTVSLWSDFQNAGQFHCMISAHIRSFSGPYFATFGLNSERYGVSLRIEPEYGKIPTRKVPNTDTFLRSFYGQIVVRIRSRLLLEGSAYFEPSVKEVRRLLEGCAY